MAFTFSPLRYPGGKTYFANILAETISCNFSDPPVYIEPYAGGAGAALSLLFSNAVRSIHINDANKELFTFWHTLLNRTEEFIERIRETPVTIEEWHKQREIFKNPVSQSDLDVGFSVFFLNRCNRSGILYAGPIGGQKQSGKYKIDARFNKDSLIKRINRINLYKDRIYISNYDAIDLFNIMNTDDSFDDNTIAFIDPPYINQGSNMYLDYYNQEDHIILSKYLQDILNIKWVLTYDKCDIISKLYRNLSQYEYIANYYAHTNKKGKELVIVSADCKVPQLLLDTQKLTLAKISEEMQL